MKKLNNRLDLEKKWGSGANAPRRIPDNIPEIPKSYYKPVNTN